MKKNTPQGNKQDQPKAPAKQDQKQPATSDFQEQLARQVSAGGFNLGPSYPSTQPVRQDAVLRMQEKMGNAYVAQHIQTMLAPMGGDFRLVQREGVPVDDIEGDPTAPADAGTSLHPTIRSGSRGPAVEELQQKLNADGATPELVVDGIFGPLTRAAAVAFQGKYTLDEDGILGPLTWGQIDSLGLASDVGRVERDWSEEVGGQTYGMTSKYTWRILADSMQITVKLRFTGVDSPEAIATSMAGINSVWNRFTAVNTTSGTRYNIVFNAQQVGSGADNVVRLRPGNDRSDAENWYIGDPDLANTAAHEFGHMVGLEDEYQRTHRDYERLTGEEPPTGETAEEGAATPASVAEEMNNALMEDDEATRVANATGVISTHSIEQGEYAQQIATAYQLAYGTGIVDHIVARIPDDDEFFIVDPFTHSSEGIMGNMTDHDHPAEPRHLREFLGYLETARPGDYEVEER